MWCLSLKSVVWVRLKQIFLSVFSDISHSDCGNIQISKKKTTETTRAKMETPGGSLDVIK